MPVILKDGKKQWKPVPRSQQMRGTPLNPNAADEARYYAALRKMIVAMARKVRADIETLFHDDTAQEYFATDASIAAQAKVVMAALTASFQEIFDIASHPLAESVTAAAAKTSAVALQTSLKKLSGGLSLSTNILTGDLQDILRATVTENVGLIKSIPSEYLTQVNGAVMRSITTGNGLADLVPFLQKQEGITLRRARIIAQDQTRKAFSNINFARMDKVGIKQYEWLHSAGGQKPRRLHQRMSGNIYRIDKPPIIDEKTGQRGKPGDLINCRCRAVPVIKFDEGNA